MVFNVLLELYHTDESVIKNLGMYVAVVCIRGCTFKLYILVNDFSSLLEIPRLEWSNAVLKVDICNELVLGLVPNIRLNVSDCFWFGRSAQGYSIYFTDLHICLDISIQYNCSVSSGMCGCITRFLMNFNQVCV